MEDLRAKRQHLQSFLLRHGRVFTGRGAWTRAHTRWLCELSFEHPAQHLVLAEYRQAIADAETRLERLDRQVAELVPSWSMAPVVAAYQAMRGVAFLSAVTVVAEIGDVRRFDSPRQLMAYLGLVPSESSTGERVRRGGITKAGNGRARRVLIEGAWTYRFRARMSRLLRGAAGRPAEGRAGDRLEGAAAPLRPLPQAHGPRQAAGRGHHRDRARDGRLPVGDRPRSRAAACGLSRKSLHQHRTHRRRSIQVRPTHGCCASLGAGPRQGNPRDELCGRQPSTPAGRSRQPRTNTRECGSQSAHQSLLTVVSAALPPALRNSSCTARLRGFRGGCTFMPKQVDDEHQSSCLLAERAGSTAARRRPSARPSSGSAVSSMISTASGPPTSRSASRASTAASGAVVPGRAADEVVQLIAIRGRDPCRHRLHALALPRAQQAPHIDRGPALPRLVAEGLQERLQPLGESGLPVCRRFDHAPPRRAAPQSRRPSTYQADSRTTKPAFPRWPSVSPAQNGWRPSPAPLGSDLADPSGADAPVAER